MPYTEFHYTPTGTGVISGKEVLEQTEDAINDLGGQISGDVQTAIDTANNALNTANTASADAQNAVNTANTAYTAATNAQNTANTAQSTATAAQSTATAAQNDVDALENVVTGIDGRLTTTEGNVTNLTTRMDTAEGNITTLRNDVITAQGTATSAQNTATLARGQAYVVRYASVAVSDNSTVPYTDLNNTDNIKVNDLLLDTNGKIYQISSVDTSNETVSVTTPLTQLAVDSDVVHKSGDETVGGVKSFSDDTYIKSLNFTNEVPSQSSSNSSIMPLITTITYGDSSPSVQARLNLRVTADGIKSFYPHENNAYSLGLSSRFFSDFYSYHGYFRGQQQGDEYSNNTRTNLTLLANRDSVGQSGCVVDTFRENTSQGTGSHILGIGMKENSVRYEGCRFSWFYDDDNNGYVFALRPTKQGTNQPIKYELGTSTSKWSTINGLNPSSLSLPDLNNGIDISGYITVNGGNKESFYTPTVDGWVSVALTRAGGSSVAVMLKQGNFASSGHRVQLEDSTATCNAMLPVKGGVQVSINSALADGIDFAYFYPCQGNV